MRRQTLEFMEQRRHIITYHAFEEWSIVMVGMSQVERNLPTET